MVKDDLRQKHCMPCEGGTPPLAENEVERLMNDLQGWEIAERKLCRTYRFKNWYRTIAFVNALAWIAHRENHHPDLEVSYNRCRVSYSTHAIGGLSENDFICAAKVDALLSQDEEG